MLEKIILCENALLLVNRNKWMLLYNLITRPRILQDMGRDMLN